MKAQVKENTNAESTDVENVKARKQKRLRDSTKTESAGKTQKRKAFKRRRKRIGGKRLNPSYKRRIAHKQIRMT